MHQFFPSDPASNLNQKGSPKEYSSDIKTSILMCQLITTNIALVGLKAARVLLDLRVHVCPPSHDESYPYRNIFRGCDEILEYCRIKLGQGATSGPNVERDLGAGRHMST